MTPVRLTRVAMLLVVGALTVLPARPAMAASTYEIHILNSDCTTHPAFDRTGESPDLPAPAKVVFTNDDTCTWYIKIDSSDWKPIGAGSSISVTFPDPGRHEYSEPSAGTTGGYINVTPPPPPPSPAPPSPSPSPAVNPESPAYTPVAAARTASAPSPGEAQATTAPSTQFTEAGPAPSSTVLTPAPATAPTGGASSTEPPIALVSAAPAADGSQDANLLSRGGVVVGALGGSFIGVAGALMLLRRFQRRS